jgi:Tfp pilus assembly protein PilN
VTALEASPFFESVKTKSTATKKERDRNVATFEIVMQLTSPTANAVANAPAKPVEDAETTKKQPVQAK